MAKKLVLWAICLVILAAVLANGTSSALSSWRPGLALMLNPFNSAARIALLNRDVIAEEWSEEKVLQHALDGNRFAPSNVRFLSMLGLIRERQGQVEFALKHYDRVLKHLPTEFQALARRFLYAVQNREYMRAVNLAEIIGRRWPSKWELVSRFLPAILKSDETLLAMSTGLGKTKRGRALLVQALKNDPAGHNAAYRMMLLWYKMKIPDIGSEISAVTKSLFDQGQERTAYFLFQQTLDKRTKEKQSGYVFNGRFEVQPSGSPFDWTIKNQAGVIIERQSQRNGGVEDGEASYELALNFRNAPVRLDNVSQFAFLPSGEYQLAVQYRTQGLLAPKPVTVTVVCPKLNKVLAQIPISEPDVDLVERTALFTVPAGNCPSSKIYLSTDVIEKSWKNRYKGKLFISRIGITFRGAS